MADRNPRWDEYFPIFDAALDLPTSERDAYLDGACGTDSDLRAEVERLLNADAGATGLLDSGPSTWSRFLEEKNGEPDTLTGRQVGSFRLVKEIGRGGMGVVYLGERVEGDFDQRVAVKLVSSLVENDEALVRFKLERQILAHLEHPGIARLVDGGVSVDGVPYLAMEYVDGVTIREFCDAKRLGVRDRIDLFMRACRAVQFAHENLVVHRDLKPGNILVTDTGEPKLLDFGIAKILETDSPSINATTVMALTPGYAAPEQVRGESPTAATDVYALGMVLFELLTGGRPYRPVNSALDAQLAILNEEPTAPSGVASGVEDDRLRARSTTRDQLVAELGGDLDAIILRALRKEPEQRYATVAGLVGDLTAHAESRPVLARQGNRSYRAKKYIRRHRLPFVAGLAVVLSLVAGLAVSIMQTRAASRAKDAAVTAQSETVAINDFLVNELLGAANPEESMGRDLTVRDILDEASRSVDEAFSDAPRMEASIRRTLAQTYSSLAEYPSAREHAGRAIELFDETGGDRDALETRHFLATLSLDDGDYDSARRELQDVLREARRRDGPNAIAPLEAEVDLARALSAIGEFDSAAVMLGSVVAKFETHHPDDWKAAVRAGKYWAGALRNQHLWADAEAVCRDVLAQEIAHRGEDHPDVVRTRARLASILVEMAHYEEAIPLLHTIVDARREIYGENHPMLARAFGRLGFAYSRSSQEQKSVPLMQQALEIYRATLGDEHPETINTMMNVAIGKARVGDLDEATAMYERVFSASRRAQGPTHPKTLRYQMQLISMLMGLDRVDDARRESQEMFAVYEEMIADSTIDVEHLRNYGSDLLDTGPEDVHDAKRALEISQWASALTNRKRYEIILNEAVAAKRLGDIDHAIACCKEALALPEGIRSFSTEALLATSLIDLGRYDEAELSLVGLLRRRRGIREPTDWLIGNTLTWLGKVLKAADRTHEAEARAREAIAQLLTGHDADDFRVARARSLLGSVLAEQERFEEAEQEATEAFFSYQTDSQVRTDTLREARETVVAIYEKWGKPDSAAAWRDRPLPPE